MVWGFIVFCSLSQKAERVLGFHIPCLYLANSSKINNKTVIRDNKNQTAHLVVHFWALWVSLPRFSPCQASASLSVCAGRTWIHGKLGRAADRAVGVGRRAAKQTSILRKGLSDYQGTDLLWNESSPPETHFFVIRSISKIRWTRRQVTHTDNKVDVYLR